MSEILLLTICHGVLRMMYSREYRPCRVLHLDPAVRPSPVIRTVKHTCEILRIQCYDTHWNAVLSALTTSTARAIRALNNAIQALTKSLQRN